ncbi:hypothetical protein HX004_07710 [Myroides sp. 1354]|uniref:hypothetical protein n=1 Tax=unclassified Myroides TaxID=2642485 RepID=UPI002577772B|nr:MULTISPECIES: hypothetical protein [unclassified Myroides]MDM1044947.1 hypothetical protein [Myroides sp. R163-1]MDM1055660.1 hypothetical protein [Myroides sp. 1354]MDM1068957.1 hypothetical protein [Myroides sp. 1372]
MENIDQNSTKTRVKWAKIADISIFALCFIHLILWIIRASYLTGFHTGEWAAWVYNELYTPMYYALYALPIALGFSVINRKLSVDSFAFLSFKSLVITYVLIFILR